MKKDNKSTIQTARLKDILPPSMLKGKNPNDVMVFGETGQAVPETAEAAFELLREIKKSSGKLEKGTTISAMVDGKKVEFKV